MTTIELETKDGTGFSAYRSEPAGDPIGGVLVIQEIFGVNAHIRSVADRFAEAGYLAIAPALFDRVERGVELAYDQDGTEKGRDIAWNLTVGTSMEELRATAKLLSSEVGGGDHVGAVGFCWGGMLAAAVASRLPRYVAAAVAYYPSMAAQVLIRDVPNVPLLVQLGSQDTRVTPEDGETLAERWPDAEFRTYDAGHGFNCDQRKGYDPAAADLAWRRTMAFLEQHLGAEADLDAED